ncbi:GNAT family N-acetyltransferase [Candidatus Bipolaricaulota bacterium]|nr:GNAT family N-acetyltransferase [Candidatus Bipolaricaulota bacterium]
MDFKLRKAKEDDLSEIVRLNGKLADLYAERDDYYLPASSTREDFRDKLGGWFEDPEAMVLVLDGNEKLKGYFVGLVEETKYFVRPEREGRISDAYVEPDSREMGGARRALERFKIWFADHGVDVIRLSVGSKSEEAIKAWRSLGFEGYMKRMKLEV